MILKRKRTTVEYLNEDLKQNWTEHRWDGIVAYRDQFGCSIRRNAKSGDFVLSHRGIDLLTVFCLNAAKEISRIYINDVIANTQRKPNSKNTKTKY
jgi:hypothetical protein